MRTLLALLLLIPLLAGAASPTPPTLSYLGQAVVYYDLLAEAPWMPLMWQQLNVTVPDTTATLRMTAKLIVSGTTYGCDDNDLLSLRSGPDVVLSGTNYTVGNKTGRWSGPVSSTTELWAEFTYNGAAATDVLPLLRQLHYANLGGSRSVGRRRVDIQLHTRKGGTTLTSAVISLVVQPGTLEGTPFLRFDPISMQLGSDAPWRPVASYDSRPSTAPTWLLQARPTLVTMLGNGSQDVGTALMSAPVGSPGWPMAAFVDNALQLRPESIGSEVFIIRLSDGGATIALQVQVTVGVDTRSVIVLADMPLEITAGVETSVRLTINRAGSWVASFEPFPGSTTSPTALSGTFAPPADDGSPHRELLLLGHVGGPAWVDGILVIREVGNGNAIVAKIPFRIHLKGNAG